MKVEFITVVYKLNPGISADKLVDDFDSSIHERLSGASCIAVRSGDVLSALESNAVEVE